MLDYRLNGTVHIQFTQIINFSTEAKTENCVHDLQIHIFPHLTACWSLLEGYIIKEFK